MSIKRYNDFIKDKANEELDPQIAPTRPEREVETEVMPGTTEKPGEAPSRPSPIKRERTSPVPAPAKAAMEEGEDPMEEEGNEYNGQKMMQELSNKLNTEILPDNSIEYNGQKINFFSETEKFHVGKNKFKTADEVVNFLNANETPTNSAEEPLEDEFNESPDEDEFLEDDFDMGEETTESKSYKHTRKFESFKRK